MWSQQATGSRCGCELAWDEVWVRGTVFCCWGCATARACEAGADCGEAGKGSGVATDGPQGAVRRATEAFREGSN